jgi:hypothetical protein
MLLLLLLLLLLWGIACKRAIAGAGGDGASGVTARGRDMQATFPCPLCYLCYSSAAPKLNDPCLII